MSKTCRGRENLDVFFHDLSNSVLTEDGKVLIIPSTTEGIPPFEIYVRECWVQIYNLIYDSYKNKKFDDFVVTGSPGIGKSMFSYYFMWMCMKEVDFHGFYWERQKGIIFHYSPLRGTRTFTVGLSHLKYENIPHLVDLQEKTIPSDLVTDCRVIFSSPNADRLKEVLKGDFAQGFIQPPWTLKEVLEAHSRITRYRELIDINIVMSQYEVYGGVPRYLFAQRFRGDIAMRNALALKAWCFIDAFMGSKMHMLEDEDSYLIMHLYPKNTNSFSYDDKLRLPASPWVLEELERGDILKLDSNNVGYKRWRRGPFVTGTRWIFESFCLKLLQGRTHQLERLMPNSQGKVNTSVSMVPRSIQIASVAMDPASSLTPERLQLWTPEPEVFYKIIESNAESVDAFVMTRHRDLILFQFAIAEGHAVEVKGLENILNRFHGSFDTATLAFICPDFNRLHTMQNLVLENKICRDLPSIIEKHDLDSVQYALILRFPPLETHHEV